jgi:hypothetical protein
MQILHAKLCKSGLTIGSHVNLLLNYKEMELAYGVVSGENRRAGRAGRRVAGVK